MSTIAANATHMPAYMLTCASLTVDGAGLTVEIWVLSITSDCS